MTKGHQAPTAKPVTAFPEFDHISGNALLE